MTAATEKIDALINQIEKSAYSASNAFVLVTKWPTKGKSKTRLSKCIGADLAISFALSALKDLLIYYAKLPHKKFLLFAPKQAQSNFEQLLKELNLTNKEYNLVPMRDSDLKTSDLGGKLSGCIEDIRNKPYNIDGSICFIGSDCLELRRDNILTANKYTNSKQDKDYAYIIPANDGGYVMVDLPPNATQKVCERIFCNMIKCILMLF